MQFLKNIESKMCFFYHSASNSAIRWRAMLLVGVGVVGALCTW